MHPAEETVPPQRADAAPHPRGADNPVEYLKNTGDRYQSFQDLRGQMCQVLTEDFFDRLNQHGPFIDYQGKLYVRLGSRGGYSPYLGRDRYSARAEGDQILLTRYAYYRASDDNDQPAQVRAMPILLKRTAEGWRVDYLDLPY